MADPVSAAAGFVGIIVPALHGVRLLRDDIVNISDAPKAIESLKEDLLSVEMAMEALEAVESSEWESLGQAVQNQSKSTVSTCKTKCDAFREGLQRWTKHSGAGKLSWRDQVNVGVWQQRNIKSLCVQLQNCKSTLNVTASIATLHSTIRQTTMTEKLKETIGVRELEITATMAIRDEQIAEVGRQLGEVSIAEPALRGDEARERDEVLKQLTEEREALSESRKLLEGLLAKTKERSGVTITNVHVSGQGSKSVAGLVNTSADGKTMLLDNINVSSGGSSIVGIAQGVSLDKFF